MIDIRYHIYSLAAVFFALALGIVIGTSFAKRSPATEGERRTITRYENSMRVLKREIERTAEEAAHEKTLAKNSEDFCRAVLPIVVKERLEWRNVAIVQTGDYDDLSGSVKQALESAGATVTSITDLSREFPFGDDQKIAEVLANCGMPIAGDTGQARDKLFAIIADTLRSASYTSILPKLEEAGVAEFTGDYQRFNRFVVLVGGARSEEDNTAQVVDTQLITQLEKKGLIVAGCESTQAVSSYISAWHKMGIATVDNADSAIGQIALVCALGGERSQFGIKDTADRLVPRSLESSK